MQAGRDRRWRASRETTTSEAVRIKQLEAEVRELRQPCQVADQKCLLVVFHLLVSSTSRWPHRYRWTPPRQSVQAMQSGRRRQYRPFLALMKLSLDGEGSAVTTVMWGVRPFPIANETKRFRIVRFERDQNEESIYRRRRVGNESRLELTSNGSQKSTFIVNQLALRIYGKDRIQVPGVPLCRG